MLYWGVSRLNTNKDMAREYIYIYIPARQRGTALMPNFSCMNEHSCSNVVPVENSSETINIQIVKLIDR